MLPQYRFSVERSSDIFGIPHLVPSQVGEACSFGCSRDIEQRTIRSCKICCGIERVDSVIRWLQIDNNLHQRVIIVGIWGMGGRGKTTLTKAVFNKIRLGFEAYCFVSDVRPSDLKELQIQVLKDLLKVNLEVNNVDHGKSLLRARLACVRVLLILDDVDDIKQLEALGIDWLGPTSRVIVTTRDQQILKTKGNSEIYKMEGLSDKQALELFCWHAFMRATPDKIYEDLSIQIANACGGLPLSLEVLGSFLYNVEDSRCWIEILMRLNSGMFPSLNESLQISYNALNYEEKQIFLDIACFFIGSEREIAISFWEASKWRVLSSIMNLQLKSLIKLTNDDRFMMHDQLRDMGRAIVAEESHENPGKRSRLWHPDDVNQVIDQRRVRMCSLQMLIFPRIHGYDAELLLHHCPELCELPPLPGGLLRVDIGDCLQLRKVSDMSSLNKLEVLVLCNCKQIAELPGLESLQSLRELNLSECKNLPNKVFIDLKGLKSLQALHLSGCALSETDLHELIKQLSLSANGVPQSLECNLMKAKSRWIEFGPNITYVDATIPMDMNAKCRGVIFCFLLKFERPQSKAALETVHCGQIVIERDGEEIFYTKGESSTDNEVAGWRFGMCVFSNALGQSRPTKCHNKEESDAAFVWSRSGG
eukprot:Gb_30990 [translate_table: standard]